MADEIDDAAVAAAVAEQRATDPRLEQQQAAPEPAPEPIVEADPPPAAPEAQGDETPPETPPAAEKKAKKSPVEVLTGRVGHLTKQLGAKDGEIEAARARADAAEALLAAQGRTAAPEGGDAVPAAPAASPQAQPGARAYTQAEFDAAVAARAEATAFNRAADAMYNAGAEKFPDWKESVELLNAAGLMNKDVLDAAMATDAGSEVIHHLGTDIEEAQRIAALPPIRMAAELTKLAGKLAAPKQTPISNASAPIRPVSGAVSPNVDLVNAAGGGNDMSAYAAVRAKQGARWAQPRGRRA